MKRTIALLLLVAARWPSAASAQPPPDLSDGDHSASGRRAGPGPQIPARPRANQARAGQRRDLLSSRCHHHGGDLLVAQGQGEARPGAFPHSLDMLGSGTWLNCPIGEIQRDKARKYLEPFQNALKEVELGALRSTCDWEFDQRKEGIVLAAPGDPGDAGRWRG